MQSDDFADAPENVNERRAMAKEDASLWTPREALISLLRRIDSGEIKPECLVIAVGEKLGRGKTDTHFHVAGANAITALGLIERAKFQMQKE